jgi:hypothetical protein
MLHALEGAKLLPEGSWPDGPGSAARRRLQSESARYNPLTPISRLFSPALVVLFVLTALFRFMALANGFTNDQFLHLANTQQLLHGAWPTRDFLDPGMPLMYVASAAAQLIFGRTLFAEGVLVSAAFAAAAVLTALAVRHLTGSVLIALVAGALEVAIAPRAYGYPKILMYAVAFLAMQRYVTRPTTRRLFALAVCVVVAFLFRHDHGIYLGAGAAVAVWLTPQTGGWRGSSRRLLVFAGGVAALTTPYLAYVQVHGGLWPYLQAGLEFRDRELARAGYVWPSLVGDDPLQAWLFYEYLVLPAAAVLVLLMWRHRGNQPLQDGGEDIRTIAARVAPAAVVGLLVNTTIVRPPLVARLPDAIVPGVMLGAWLFACAWRARPRAAWRVATAAMAVLAMASVVVPNHTVNHLAGAGMLQPFWRWPERLRVTRDRLTAPHAEQMLPSRAAMALTPFYQYVARCTAADDRLLIVGLIPEAAVFARRAFAGGQMALIAGYYEDERHQRSIVRHLQREKAPFVLIQGGADADDFAAAFPMVAGYVRARYVPFATYGDADGPAGVRVIRDAGKPVARLDHATGLPCLR